MTISRWLATCALLLALAGRALTDDPVTLQTVKDPGPNRLDEPAGEFSVDRAVQFLDSAALNWQKQKNCFSCHTNYSYLYSRPMISAEGPALKEVRQFAEELVTKDWPAKNKPKYEADTVAMAMALAFHDAATTKKLHAATKSAFDWMWKYQRPDGGWNWLKCDWPPMESDDHYGATLAAIAVGAAPEKYAQTPEAKKGMAGVREYLKKNPPPMLHHEAMLLWGASYTADLIPAKEKKATQDKLLALQKPDGGWNLPSLGKWKRGDGKEQDLESSDGYATGFVVYVLHRAGIDAKDPRLQKGIGWLKSNQKASGRWFTRSAFRDNKHYITHAGTAFALMALAECGELPKIAAKGK